MAEKAAINSYTRLTKQQWSAIHGCQSSNNQLHMADKAAMFIYTRLTKLQ
jgi:tRNA splicing ligase